ncbi:MAG: hypothetical protein R2854_12170 [Caldilineaceae bacterium]
MPREVALFLFDGGYVGVNPVENSAANVLSAGHLRRLRPWRT